MNKHGAVVSVHTAVDNTTGSQDVTENYTREQFTKVVIIFGKAAVREVAYIGKSFLFATCYMVCCLHFVYFLI